MQRRLWPTTISTTLGERKLPKGRALAVGVIALAVLLIGCAPTATNPEIPTTSADAAPSAAPNATSGIPTLGTRPPLGLVLPSYFVTLLNSRNGSVTVLTAPGSRCLLTVSTGDGTPSEYAPRVVDASGTATFVYTPVTGRGQSIQTVSCDLNRAHDSAKAKVLLP